MDRSAGHRRLPEAARLILVMVAAALAAGVLGSLLTLALRLVQSLTFGYVEPAFGEVREVHWLRRVLGPALGGLLAGAGWWWLRRRYRIIELTDVLRRRPARMGLWRSWADALLQILVVGSGASIGREGAPRQAAAAAAEAMAARAGLSREQRRTTMGAAAGAGLAAVYNVPLSGAIFSLEVLLRGRSWPALVTCLVMSLLATVTAWPVVGRRPTYEFPQLQPDAATWLFCVAAVPLCAALGLGFRRLADRVQQAAPGPGWRLPAEMAAAGAVVGALSCWLPALPGNGQDILHVAFEARAGELMFLGLLLLKPLVTALCLRSGAVGGLLTPSLAAGGALGGLVATTGSAFDVTACVPLFALVGAVGVLSVSQRAPIFAAVFGWELTHPTWSMLGCLLLVSFGSQLAVHAVQALQRRVHRSTQDD